jgi:hypothetical protein
MNHRRPCARAKAVSRFACHRSPNALARKSTIRRLNYFHIKITGAGWMNRKKLLKSAGSLLPDQPDCSMFLVATVLAVLAAFPACGRFNRYCGKKKAQV